MTPSGAETPSRSRPAARSRESAIEPDRPRTLGVRGRARPPIRAARTSGHAPSPRGASTILGVRPHFLSCLQMGCDQRSRALKLSRERRETAGPPRGQLARASNERGEHRCSISFSMPLSGKKGRGLRVPLCSTLASAVSTSCSRNFWPNASVRTPRYSPRSCASGARRDHKRGAR